MAEVTDLHARIVEALNTAYEPSPGASPAVEKTHRHDGHHFYFACHVCQGDVDKIADAVMSVVAATEPDRKARAIAGLVAFLDWLDEDHPANLYLIEALEPGLMRRFRASLGGVHSHASGVSGPVLQIGHTTGEVHLHG